MKSTTYSMTAAAGVLALASLATAQSFCAITCFQNVVTEHPPLDCTEENMYLCFCKSQSLQNYFIDCAYDDCASEAQAAVDFGVNLCSELGAPITVQPRPTTTAEEATTAPAPEATPTEDAEEETTTEPAPATTEEPAGEPSATGAPAPGPSEPAEESTVAEVPTQSGYPVPSASGAPETETSIIAAPTGNGTVPEPSEVPAAGVAMNGVSGIVVAGVAVLAAAQLL